jgi:hypothetical protein
MILYKYYPISSMVEQVCYMHLTVVRFRYWVPIFCATDYTYNQSLPPTQRTPV